MAKIVGFMGVIGGGKNYQQNLLVSKGFAALDFKDELIDMCSDLVGYDIRQDYDWFKTHTVGVKRPTGRLQTIITEVEDWIHQRLHPEAMTGRRMLQRMGTEVMRKRDPDYWVKAWSKKAKEILKEKDGIAVADVRFLNEMMAIHGLRGEGYETELVFCDYYSNRYECTSKHESEKLAQELLRLGYKDGDLINMTPFILRSTPPQTPQKQ